MPTELFGRALNSDLILATYLLLASLVVFLVAAVVGLFTGKDASESLKMFSFVGMVIGATVFGFVSVVACKMWSKWYLGV
jgi:uncharacterized membrane protein YedE/YeeE